MIIRVSESDREDFLEACEARDTSAAREIRRFMRGYVEAHGAGKNKKD